MSNLAWRLTARTTAGLFSRGWRPTGWAGRWWGGRCRGWTFLSCWSRGNWSGSWGCSPQRLRTGRRSVKKKGWHLNEGTCTKQSIASKKDKTALFRHASCFDYLWLLRGSGVRDTLRMGLPLCEGDCCLRWLDGDELEVSKRPWGLVEPLTLRLRFAGDGERRLAAPLGDRVSLLGLTEGNMGLLLCLGGDEEVGGVRLLWAGELLRFGDLEGRRLAPGEERLAGELDTLLFCGGKGEGL